MLKDEIAKMPETFQFSKISIHIGQIVVSVNRPERELLVTGYDNDYATCFFNEHGAMKTKSFSREMLRHLTQV